MRLLSKRDVTQRLPEGCTPSSNLSVLFGGKGGMNAASLWKVADNNRSRHRDEGIVLAGAGS